MKELNNVLDRDNWDYRFCNKWYKTSGFKAI